MASLQPTAFSLSEHDLGPLLRFVSGAAPKWREIGLALGFRPTVLDTIAAKPENVSQGATACFNDMLSRWLKWAPPKHHSPSLEILVEALREDTVGEEKMANNLMLGFQRTLSSAVMPQTEMMALPQQNSVETPRNVTVGTSSFSKPPSSTNPLTPTAMAGSPPTDHQSAESACANPTSLATSSLSVEEVKAKIHEFQQRFNGLKTSTQTGLELLGVTVQKVVECLLNLPVDDMEEYKVFLEEHMDNLLNAESLFKLFLRMNFYWNYLTYHLLEHLITAFSVVEIKGEMETYKQDLQLFMWDTPLEVFCETQKKKIVKVPEGFTEMVVKFKWPKNQKVTLGKVEEYRQQYAYCYKLREFAMMLITIKPGSFIVVWAIPVSIIKHLLKEVAENILSKYEVATLEIAGDCVYKMPTSSGSATDGPPEGAATQHQEATSTDLEYDSVNLSQDFYCPVTKGVLLDPHQTRCCGNILSAEAVSRIQEEGGACPLCKFASLKTYPDKNFQRRVREQKVFCPNKKRGCAWEGELANIDSHEKFCSKKNATVTEPPSKAHSAPEIGITWKRKIEVLSESTPVGSSSFSDQPSTISQPPSPDLQSPLVSSGACLTAQANNSVVFRNEQVRTLLNPKGLEPKPYIVGKLRHPRGVAISKNPEVIYVADKGSSNNALVMRIQGDAEKTTKDVVDAYGLALDEEGYVYATDCHNHHLYKFDNQLNFLKKVGTGRSGWSNEDLSYPCGVNVIKGMVYVCNDGSCRVKVYGRDLEYKYSFGKTEEKYDEQTLFGPVDIAGDSGDGLYVADNKKMAIVKFHMRNSDPPEFVKNIKDKELRVPSGLTVDYHDFIYVTDKLSNHVVVFNSKGDVLTTLWQGIIRTPRAICCVKGNVLSEIYVSDNDTEVNVWKCDMQYM